MQNWQNFTSVQNMGNSPQQFYIKLTRPIADHQSHPAAQHKDLVSCNIKPDRYRKPDMLVNRASVYKNLQTRAHIFPKSWLPEQKRSRQFLRGIFTKQVTFFGHVQQHSSHNFSEIHTGDCFFKNLPPQILKTIVVESISDRKTNGKPECRVIEKTKTLPAHRD